MKIEDREFFDKDAINLSKDILGKILVRKIDGKILKGRIVETEAYMGIYDKAAHSYNFKQTNRTKNIYVPPGHLYIALTYGLYNCVNITCGEKYNYGTTLIRALEPLEGIETIKLNRNNTNIKNLCNGPGKLSMAFKIDKNLLGVDLTTSDLIWLEDDNFKPKEIFSSKRIGIDYAEEFVDKPWRFYIKII